MTLDVEAFWKRSQLRYPKLLARLHQSEKEDAAVAALRAAYNDVLTERIPDDLREIVEGLR